ncbi:MAG TPA: sodium:proton exchanger [Gammaproteobacteria bacterium]|nr:sodium:proton exchanger [Gammaproteobacteria bacterium]
MPVVLEIVLMLLVIVVAAEIFTNALEHLGEKLGISEGVTGSLFAAVGTAMPESMVPLVAIFTAGVDHAVREEIGVGAILGAPLMLSTLSLFLMGSAVLGKRGAGAWLHPEPSGLRRDLLFFLIAFGFAFIGLFVPKTLGGVKVFLAVLLVLTYFIYVLLTLRKSSALVEAGHATEAHGTMLLCRTGLPNTIPVIVVQILLGLALLILGAKGFVHGVEAASAIIGISPLLLSLLIIPIATELPEKVNSIIWIRRGKDTLAFGNITGAMVFQGSLLPALGLAMTPWEPSLPVLSGVLITYAAGLWLFFLAHHGGIRVWHLGINGALYAFYLWLVLG